MSVVGSFATDHVQLFEDYFLGHAFHLDEDVVQCDFCQVMLEVMFLRAAVVCPQDVDFRIFTQTLHCVSVFGVKVAQIFLRKFRRGAPTVGRD